MIDTSNNHPEREHYPVFSDHKRFPIPIVMISKRDGALLLHYLKSRSERTTVGKSIKKQSKRADGDIIRMEIVSAPQETVISVADNIHVQIPSTRAEMNNWNHRSIMH